MRIQETVEVIDGDDDSSEVYIQLTLINSEFRRPGFILRG